MVNLADLPNAGPLSGSETLPMQQGSGAVKVTANQLLSRASGQVLPFDIGGTRAVTITSTGVGIGTSTPSCALVVDGDIGFSYSPTLSGNGIRRKGLATEYFNTLTGIASELIHDFTGSVGQTFLGITGNGTVLFGKTTSSSATTGIEFRRPGQIVANEESTNALHLGRLSNNGPVANFSRGGGVVGSISVTESATTYNTSSDCRLPWKAGHTDLTGSGEFIDALNPRYFPLVGHAGFIAHEVQEVSPSSVTGEKDAVDEDGNPVYQQMDASSPDVMANIVAELQDLRRRVAALEAAT